MDILLILKPLGGLGLFIYGMLTMGNALEKLAGEKIVPLMEAECRALAGFHAEECRAFLDLTRKYIDQLRMEMDKM